MQKRRRLIEIRFYIQLDTKTGQFGDVIPSQSLKLVLKKLNLIQQKQTRIYKSRDHITQN